MYRKKDALLNTTSPSLPPLREQPRRSTEGPFAEPLRPPISVPDSCFCPSRGGSPAGRPSGHAHSTNHAHVYAPYPPRHPLCHRSALRAPHSTVTFERRLITRASEISWAVAWWSQSSARPILILGRRSPIPAGAWCRGLNGMPASDAAWRRPAATPQAVVGAAQRCSQRHVCSFAVGSAV